MSTQSIEFYNGEIVDGTGSRSYTGNVLVRNGRIQEISKMRIGADQEIDLQGKYLTPGFIDMHSHSDLRLLNRPRAPEKLTQGVTTEVLGQDGVSVAPIPSDLEKEWQSRIQPLNGAYDLPWPWNTIRQYLNEVEKACPAVNCAYYAPHGNLRSLHAGFDDRELEAYEQELLEIDLDVAIEHGAFGMSTGMIYPPSSYGSEEELEALAKTLAARGSFMISHIWNETDRVVESVKRYLDMCNRAGCHAHVSHLKIGDKQNWGRADEILSLFDLAEQRGQRVSFDQYPYTAGSTMLTALLPPWARNGTSETVLSRLRDPQLRTDMEDDINSPGNWENLVRAAGGWENILITNTSSGEYEGKTVADIAESRDSNPIDIVCDILLQENLNVTIADFVMCEKDIKNFLTDHRGSICTDGIFGGKPHPRAIGTFPRIIERYVQDHSVISIEEAIYKAAGHPADILGLTDRGYIKEGYVADLVVFDIEQITERPTYKNPNQLTTDFDYVLVGGEVAVKDGHLTGKRNGQVLRSTEEWNAPTRPRISRANR